jgi:hypothetical protein
VFPFISFVVAITNSTNAAKEEKQNDALKLLVRIINTEAHTSFTFLKHKD